MQASIRREVLYSDVGADFRATLPMLLRLFQDVAALHSEKTGWGLISLRDRGIVWVLNKLALEVERYPRYGETVEIRSWSRGAAGVNMLRDFRIFANDECVASGASTWFFVDRDAGRVRRVPEELDEAYQAERAESALAPETLRDWAPYDRFEPEHEFTIHARRSDADASGHVNNTRYCEYLLDALGQYRRGAGEDAPGAPVRSIRLLFSCEIDPELGRLSVGLSPGEDGRLRFKVHDGETQFARGDLGC